MGVDDGGAEVGEEVGDQEEEERGREGEKDSFYTSMAGPEGGEEA